MSDELTQKRPDDVPDTEPTILTLMERLSTMQEVMDRRHIETQELITTVRDDINKSVEAKHELLMSRIDLLRTETQANFRKQGHFVRALNDTFLEIRGDHRELFERIAVLEEKVP
jgi:hypothetical protein